VLLLARLFESLPLVCPNCGADMRLIVDLHPKLTHLSG